MIIEDIEKNINKKNRKNKIRKWEKREGIIIKIKISLVSGLNQRIGC